MPRHLGDGRWVALEEPKKGLATMRAPSRDLPYDRHGRDCQRAEPGRARAKTDNQSTISKEIVEPSLNRSARFPACGVGK